MMSIWRLAGCFSISLLWSLVTWTTGACMKCDVLKFADTSFTFVGEPEIANAKSVVSCGVACHRSTTCMGMLYDKRIDKCHLFSTYQAINATGASPATTRFALQLPCGFPTTPLSGAYKREDEVVITEGHDCPEGTFLFGRNLTLYCDLQSSEWKSPGNCWNKTLRIKLPGDILHGINSTLTVAGTPVDLFFDLIISNGLMQYLLKITVSMDTKEVTRMIKLNKTIQGEETQLGVDFPFVHGTPFVMEIQSTLKEFIEDEESDEETSTTNEGRQDKSPNDDKERNEETSPTDEERQDRSPVDDKDIEADTFTANKGRQDKSPNDDKERSEETSSTDEERQDRSPVDDKDIEADTSTTDKGKQGKSPVEDNERDEDTSPVDEGRRNQLPESDEEIDDKAFASDEEIHDEFTVGDEERYEASRNEGEKQDKSPKSQEERGEETYASHEGDEGHESYGMERDENENNGLETHERSSDSED